MAIDIVNTSSGANYNPYGWQIDSQGAGLVTGSVNIIGNITIGSVTANVDSIYIQSGANIDLGSAWTNIGSVIVANPLAIGSIGIQGILGSVAVTNFPTLYPVSGIVTANVSIGSIQPYNPIGVGSMLITNGSILTYGGGGYAGSDVYIRAGSVQPYNPIGIGSVLITNAPTVGFAYATKIFPYIATGSDASINVTANPTMAYSVQVAGSPAAATAWDVRLEGSLDNTNFTQILAHTNVTGDGVVLFSAANLAPALYIRSRVAGLTLTPAGSILVSILGVQ